MNVVDPSWVHAPNIQPDDVLQPFTKILAIEQCRPQSAASIDVSLQRLAAAKESADAEAIEKAKKEAEEAQKRAEKERAEADAAMAQFEQQTKDVEKAMEKFKGKEESMFDKLYKKYDAEIKAYYDKEDQKYKDSTDTVDSEPDTAEDDEALNKAFGKKGKDEV